LRVLQRSTPLSRRHFAVILGALVLVVLLVAVVITAGGGSNPVDTFNACLRNTHFLVATKHRADRRMVDVIRDRATGVMVGEVAVLPTVRAAETFTSSIGPPGGSGARNGRMILFTRVPSGRDANAIITCSLPEFPPA